MGSKVKLSEIVVHQKGFAFKSKDYQNCGVQIVRVSNFTLDSVDLSDLKYISESDATNVQSVRLEQGDVVIATVGSWPSNPASVVGKVISIPQYISGSLLNQNAVRLRVKDFNNVDQNFLYYSLKNRFFSHYITSTAQGSANQASITLKDILKYEIYYPEFEKRKKIACYLKAFDDKITLNQEMNKTLEAMAQALFKLWFVDIKQNEYVSLRDYIELNPKIPLRKGTNAPAIDMKDLSTRSMSINAIAEKKAYNGGAKFQNNHTLLARITPCLENGKTAFVDFLNVDEIGFGSTEFIVMQAKEHVSPYYVYCLARDDDFRNYAIKSMVGSSGRQRVQVDALTNYVVPKISNETFLQFTKSVNKLFNKIRLNTLDIQNMTKIRNALLPKLINGEINV